MLSPVLIGRDDLLALGDRRLQAAHDGAGHLLFLAGEAGIGKTRLLESLVRKARRLGFTVARAGTAADDLELTGGLLLDLASDLTASFPAVADQLRARLTATEPGADGDPHRRRRLMVLDLAQLLSGLAADGPMLITLEDLHWADDLSLEVVAQLARRIRERPLIVLGTYRSDELYPRVPMREWRTRLLTQRLAEEARLGRLSRAETMAMIRAVLGDREPDLDATAVFERSDGIPLHVEEFVAALDRHLVPDTLADAVLGRFGALSEGAQRVAAAAAVIGRSFDFDLLAEVLDEEPSTVGDALRELRDRSFVEPGPGTGYEFRHALIRDALYADIPLPHRRTRHAQVVRAAAARSRPAAFLSVHCEAADLLGEAYRYARDAAESASALSSHREAYELYKRAARCQAHDAPPLERAALLAALAAEAAAVDDNPAAADAYEEAFRRYAEQGRPAAAAALVAPLVATRHLLGDGLADRAGRLAAGLGLLSDAAPTAPTPSTVDVSGAVDGADALDDVGAARLSLLAELAAAHMLDRRLDAAIEHGEAALALAEERGDEAAELNASITLGSVLVFAGRMEDGWRLIEQGTNRAVAHRQEAQAARGYRMIGSCASVLVEYDLAKRWLSEGIEYADRVELWNHRHYMGAHLGHVAWAVGDWDLALSLANEALADGRGGLTTQITARHVLGYVALGRGAFDEARLHLEQARAQGARMAELQRLSPALWGLAEAALLSSDVDGAVALCEEGMAESERVEDAAYLYPFLVTGTRARLARADPLAATDWVERGARLLRRRGIPGTLPAIDHAEGLIELAAGRTGAARTRLEAAERAWRERDRFWEGSFCRLDLAKVAQRTRRGAEAAELTAGVRAAATRVGSAPLLAAADAVTSSTEDLWRPLSAREFEVATLIASGLTNREVAARLVVSPKTVSAHVEHILAKLGATRRSEIAAWAATIRRPAS